MKGQDGFSLVELVVVVVSILTLTAVATLYFRPLNEKHQVESLTKEMYSVLMRARNDASTTSTPQIVIVTANGMRSGPDADANGVIDGNPVGVVQAPGYTITFAASPITFDRRGLANPVQTLHIPKAPIEGGYSADVNPVIDCVAIEATRINIGKMNDGGNCVQR